MALGLGLRVPRVTSECGWYHEHGGSCGTTGLLLRNFN